MLKFIVRTGRHVTCGRVRRYLCKKYDKMLSQETGMFFDRIEALEAKIRYLENIKYEIADTRTKVFLPDVMTLDETLDEIINNKKSICRFGDGEFRTLLNDEWKYFGQERNSELENRLKQVLQSKDDNVLVCVWDYFGNLDLYTDMCCDIARMHMCKIRDDLNTYLCADYRYGNAFVSRPYLEYKDKSNAPHYFSRLKQIWNNQDIIIIEGRASRLGIGNDLFDNAKSVQRVLCPAENAFAKYNEILEFSKTLPKDKLILIALGMTATVLAYDLAKCGFWALDIGHVDIEYEWFLAQADRPIPIRDKYVNEANSKQIIENHDKKYLSQIIKEIK